MRPALILSIALLAAALPLTVRAEGTRRPSAFHDIDPMPVDHGFQIGARFGASFPSGNLYGGAAPTRLDDLDGPNFPFGIDLGYRLSPRFYVGGTLTWGQGTSSSVPSCTAPASCFKEDTQIRLDARVYLAPHGKIGWWLGAGAGWELFGFSHTQGDSTSTATFMGPVLADVQLGFDIRKGMVAVGPFVGMAIGEFTTEALNPAFGGEPGITPSVHVWLSLGLRGSYGPW